MQDEAFRKFLVEVRRALLTAATAIEAYLKEAK
jgi:hypothetical protein